MLGKRAQIAPPPDWKHRLGKGFKGFVINCLLIRLFRKQSYFEGSETVQSLCKNDDSHNIVTNLKNKLYCFGHPLQREGKKVSCVKHTIKDFSPFTSHFSQLCTPHPSPLPQGAREQLSCAEHTEKDLLSNRLSVLTTLKHKLDCFAYARNDDLCAKHTEKDLFSYLPIHLFTFRKAAFTLAEVLITLGIIGIVAALTLPTLIANHQKQTLVNQLKKAVNTIENAAQSATAEEGVSSFHDTLFKCFISDGYLCWSYWKDEYKEEGNKYLKTINLALPYTSQNIIDYKTINGEECKPYGGHKTILNDGVIIYTASSDYSFWIDVNGEKGPNVLGRDLFQLSLDAYGHIVDSANVYTGVENFSFRDKIINKHLCDDIDPVANDKCFYDKIISDGWKMNY